MSQQTINDLAVAHIRCPYCHQPAGQHCITKSGNRATWLHSGRTQPMYLAWVQGLEDGEHDMAHWYLQALQSQQEGQEGEMARFHRKAERVVENYRKEQTS